MQTVQLDKKRHNRKDFDCEVEALNEYLYSMASQHSIKDNTRTYVLENSENPSNIVGYIYYGKIHHNLYLFYIRFGIQ